jgi:hypothetical protein
LLTRLTQDSQPLDKNKDLCIAKTAQFSKGVDTRHSAFQQKQRFVHCQYCTVELCVQYCTVYIWFRWRALGITTQYSTVQYLQYMMQQSVCGVGSAATSHQRGPGCAGRDAHQGNTPVGGGQAPLQTAGFCSCCDEDAGCTALPCWCEEGKAAPLLVTYQTATRKHTETTQKSAAIVDRRYISKITVLYSRPPVRYQMWHLRSRALKEQNHSPSFSRHSSEPRDLTCAGRHMVTTGKGAVFLGA